jgi:hypothetical protein
MRTAVAAADAQLPAHSTMKRGFGPKPPDYELESYLGTNLGIFTPEENIYLSSVNNSLASAAFKAEPYWDSLLSSMRKAYSQDTIWAK